MNGPVLSIQLLLNANEQHNRNSDHMTMMTIPYVSHDAVRFVFCSLADALLWLRVNIQSSNAWIKRQHFLQHIHAVWNTERPAFYLHRLLFYLLQFSTWYITNITVFCVTVRRYVFAANFTQYMSLYSMIDSGTFTSLVSSTSTSLRDWS